MSNIQAFKAITVILLSIGLCRADDTSDVPVHVPKDMCEPCSGHSVRTGGHSGGPCPNPGEVASEVVKEMMSSLNTARYLVRKELRTLHDMSDIPDTLTTLVNISNLTEIQNNSTLYIQLKATKKPRYLLELVYRRTLMFSAYTDALIRIYKKSHRRPTETLENITIELKRLACTIVDLFTNLGLGRIKRSLTKSLCKFSSHLKAQWIDDYETSILAHGEQLIEESIGDLDKLVNVTSQCNFKCKVGKNLKLRCKKQARELKRGGNRRRGRGRKNRKDRKKNRKNRKNRKNKNNTSRPKKENKVKNDTTKIRRKKNRRNGNKNNLHRLV